MYNYHSSRNRIQLIGTVANAPVKYKTEKGRILRFALEVNERDDSYQTFTSYHIVIVPADRLVPHIELGLRKYDEILVQGRLNSYEDPKIGRLICNVQAFEVMVVNKSLEPEQTFEEKEKLKRAGEVIKNPELVKNIISGKIVSLASKRAEADAVDKGDEYGEVDENGRIDDPYKTWREWKRDGFDDLPF